MNLYLFQVHPALETLCFCTVPRSQLWPFIMPGMSPASSTILLCNHEQVFPRPNTRTSAKTKSSIRGDRLPSWGPVRSSMAARLFVCSSRGLQTGRRPGRSLYPGVQSSPGLGTLLFLIFLQQVCLVRERVSVSVSVSVPPFFKASVGF